MAAGNTSIYREVIQQAAKRIGINASIGRTEKGGKYHPDKNALGRSVPIEWLESFANEIIESLANPKNIKTYQLPEVAYQQLRAYLKASTY